MQEPQQAEVLHQHGVHACCDGRPDDFFHRGQLVVEHERVECEIAADAAGAEKGHQLGQVGQAEIGCPGAGVKAALQSKIDGIGAVLHGRPAHSKSPAGAISSGKLRVGSGIDVSIQAVDTRTISPLYPHPPLPAAA